MGLKLGLFRIVQLGAVFASMLPGCSSNGDAGGGSPDAGARPALEAPTVASDESGSVRAAFVATRQRAAATDPAYAFQARDGARGFLAESPAAGLRSELSSSGVTLRAIDDGFTASLRTRAFVCGRTEHAATAVDAEGNSVATNRVHYARRVGGAEVDEWWVNGPLGLEQGFSLERSPCQSGHEFEVALELDGLSATLVNGGAGAGVELRGPDGTPRALVTDLYASDATGRTLPSAFRVEDGRLAYHVDTTDAVWPVEVDPVLAGLQATLTPNAATTTFATSLAVSGTTAIVGSPSENRAYVFVRSGNAWSLQQKIAGVTGDFGSAVALSGDTAVIGAPLHDSPYQDSGYAGVFVRSGATWSLQGNITGTTSNSIGGYRAGSAVAVAGNTALVGTNHGASVKHFQRTGTTWTEVTSFSGCNQALALEAGETFAVIGCPGSNSATVRQWNGSSWGTVASLTGSGSFGSAVAINGTTALVGAPTAAGGGTATFYVQAGASWVSQGTFTSPSASVTGFGSGVGLKGNTALVGAPTCTGCAGRAYVYTRAGSTWSASPIPLKPPIDTSGNFGQTTALETDIAVVGAPSYPANGAAFVFVPVGGACTTGSQCGTGFCFDSVCCDRDCSGSCEGCSVASGATTDGICNVYAAGSNGNPSCGTLICNGVSGACQPCVDDAGCASNRYCDATGNCQLRKSQGASCNLAQNADCKVAGCRACTSGNCVDGFCCNTVCDQECDVCSAALGASANGTCSIAPAGTNTATCVAPAACNGQSTSCATSCASDADCVATAYCAPDGTCKPRKAQGNSCNAAAGGDCKVGGCRVCATNNCVDGFCCNTGCTEVCAACNLPGKLGTCSALADGAVPDSPGCTGYLCNGSSLTCPSTCAGNGDCAQPAYYCSGTSCLPSGCVSDASCAADRYCASDGQCKLRKTQGSVCNGGAGADCLVAGCRVCDTNNCVDGYCCNSACSGQCGACNLATKEGTCSPLADGATPEAPGCSGYLCNGTATACAVTCAGDPDCASTHYCSGGACLPKACSADTDCAASYYCASDGNCKPRKGQGAACNPAAGGDCNVLGCRVCTSNNCVDGFCCNSACNEPCATCAAIGQQGACTAYADNAVPDAPGCNGYLCGGATACPTTCANDTDCATSHYCSGGQCLPKTCAGDSDCASTHYCANSGQCTVRKGNGNACNVAAGADCKVVGCRACSSDHCVDGYCCNTGCTEACGTCSGATPGVCSPLADGTTPDGSCNGYLCGGSTVSCPTTCAGDGDCASTHYCAAGACVPKKGAGEACTGSNQCGDPSFAFCADGVCCNTTCTGKCMACSAANKQSGANSGTCDAAKQGTNPNNGCIAASDPCGDQPSCSGNAGQCAKAPYGKSCGPTSCASSTTVNGKICDGTGTCIDNTNAQCAPYLCKSGSCSSPCATDADCTGGYYCSNGTCVGQSDNGKGCATAKECKSGFCVDQVCCDSPCGGQCQACAESGSLGQCKTVSGSPRPGHGACSGSGECIGSCDGANPTACTFPGASKSCGAASCNGDVAQPAGACDGNGGCAVPVTKNCLPYTCDTNTGACKATCAGDTDCAQGATCDTTTGKCAIAGATCSDATTVKLPNGQTQSCAPYKCVGGACQQQCSSPTDCAPGYTCEGSNCVGVDAGTGGSAGSGGATTGGAGGSTGGAVDGGGGAATGGKKGSGAGDSGGCGCRTPGSTPERGSGALLAVLAWAATLRRSRRACRNGRAASS